MCRFVVYLGPEITVSSLVTEPSHSLIHQSFMSHEREEPLNGDGFGVAWYVHALSGIPAVFKDITPAWNNQNLLNVARVVKSDCILAHVRAASSGLPVTQLNCHPFVWNDLAFMHNGDLGGFRELRRALISRLSDEAFGWIKGSTDSEHIFALFIDRYREADGEGAARLEAAMRGTIGTLTELRAQLGAPADAYLNLAVTDGHSAVVSRIASDGESPESLYFIGGRQYDCIDGVCMMRPGSSSAVLVASEPLSKDEGWAPVPDNHLLTIDSRRQPRLSACSL
jgi:ergothioneine biosynthesis protein EgtC